MSLAHTGELVADAVARGSAVPAFNLVTLDQAEAIVQGAERAGVAVIMQVSENAVRYRGGRMEPLLAACRELALAAGVPVSLHLDHIEDRAIIDRALAMAGSHGLSSLMFDASTLDYAENVATTAAVTVAARGSRLWVEAELGAIGGKDGAHAPGVRTDPEEARGFVEATGVDALAVAVGSSHAMVEKSARLDVALIAVLAESVPVPLVLHGSSGVPEADIRRAVTAGIRKVNVGTALGAVATAALRAALAQHPHAVDPRVYSKSGRDEMGDLVAHLCQVIAG